MQVVASALANTKVSQSTSTMAVTAAPAELELAALDADSAATHDEANAGEDSGDDSSAISQSSLAGARGCGT